MEQKVMEQMKAVKSTVKLVESSTFARPPPAHLSHTTSVKEHKSRRSVPDLSSQKELAASHGQASSATKASYKALYDQYEKNPEALKQQLKLKVQTGPLTEEENQIWQRHLEVNRRKRRKRKHEKRKLNRLNRSQPIESHSATEGVDATPGRKRTHTHNSSGHSDHLSAKLPKKSESHHHQSHDSSKHRHRRRHKRSGSRHNHHSKSHHSGHKIDEATFQQALSNAVSLVQSGQAAPNTSASEKAVPTVTLKRTGVQNGSADSYVAHSSKYDWHKASGRSNQLCFDPCAPISATPPEDLFDAEEQQKAESPNTLATESADVSSPEIGLQPVGTGPLLHLQPHPPSLPPRMKIPREEATLTAMQKVMPGLTKEDLQDVIARVDPLITKIMAKGKQGGTKTMTVSGGMTTKTTHDIRSQKEETETLHPSCCTGKMTITLMAGKKVPDKTVGPATTENTNIPGLDLVKGQNTRNQTTKEVTTENPVEAQSHVGVVGAPTASGRLRFVLPGGSGDLDYSATGPTMTTMTTVARQHTPQEDAPSSAMPQMTMKIVPPSTIKPIITPRCPPTEGSSLSIPNTPSSIPNTSHTPNVTSIGTIITPRVDQWHKSRGVDRDSLSHINPVQGPDPCYLGQGPGPCYPGQGPYLTSTLRSGHTVLYPGQGFVAAGDSIPRPNPPFYPPSFISQQNFQLLRAILNIVNPPKHDPRLAATKSRLHEKKEKTKAREELCRREAVQKMREALNKNIKVKRATTKSKTPGPGKSIQQPGSPESTNSSNSRDDARHASSGASSEQALSVFNLSNPASTRVLQEVAHALTDDGKRETTVQTSTITKPTGVVTPSPRSIQPVFMQYRNTSTEVTLSSSPQDPPNLNSEGSGPQIPSEATEVMSKIDTVLSQLKQGFQAKRNNDELKESMGKLLQLVQKLDGGGLLPASAVGEEQSTSTTVPTSQSGLFQNTPDQGDLRETLNAARRATVSANSVQPAPSSTIKVASSQSATCDTVSSLVESQTSVLRSSLEKISAERLRAAVHVCVFGNADIANLSPAVSQERDKILKEYKNQSTTTSMTSPLQNANVDEILPKLRPYIQDMNKDEQESQKPEETTFEPKNTDPEKQELEKEPSKESSATQSMINTPTARVELLAHAKAVDVQGPTSFTSRPVAENAIVRPRPTHLGEITPQVVPSESEEPMQTRPTTTEFHYLTTQSPFTSRPVAENTIVRPRPTHLGEITPQVVPSESEESMQTRPTTTEFHHSTTQPQVAPITPQVVPSESQEPMQTRPTTTEFHHSTTQPQVAPITPQVVPSESEEPMQTRPTTTEFHHSTTQPQVAPITPQVVPSESEEPMQTRPTTTEFHHSTTQPQVAPITPQVVPSESREPMQTRPTTTEFHHSTTQPQAAPITPQVVPSESQEPMQTRPTTTEFHHSTTQPQVAPITPQVVASESQDPMQTRPTTTEFHHSTTQPQVAPFVYDSHAERLEVSSPMSESNRGGTPTMDERYPNSVQTREGGGNSHNSFVVFDPENSSDCEAISMYLRFVNGLQFDVSKMVKDLQTSVNEHERKTSEDVEEEFCNILPPGTIWVVFRTVDLKHLHFMPHLALLKAAGSHVQFICADGVNDVKVRQYKHIMIGDGGIILPLRPKTIVNNLVQFRHLMLWLVGQNADAGENKNKWRIALHQHQLIALQDAEHCVDAVSRRNAAQALEWLCRVGKKKPKLAIGLPEHECDEMHLVGGDAEDLWNWYDSATDEELVKIALPCLMKIQMERVRQLRHVVVLIDGDPGALCWKPIWQTGCCVTTMEKFVDFVCSKPASSSSPQSTSRVLPLFSSALGLL